MNVHAQITRQADRDGVAAPTVERDYVLAHIIAGLGALEDSKGLVFKGGTALRLCYFEDYRYSADLDFSTTQGDLGTAYAIIEAALEVALEAVPGAVDALSLTDDDPRRIAYRGPLGRERFLKLDIADDELVLNVDTIGLLPRWPNIPDTNHILVYTLPEIAGEKLRCVMQRMQCRDLYDLWLLFEDANVDPLDAAEIFRPKAEHKNLDPERFKERYGDRLTQYRRRWTNELENHIPGDIPRFEQVEREVSRRLRAVNLL